MSLPRLIRVRQILPNRAIADIPAAIHAELTAKHLGAHLAPGSRVAIGAGSRGIHSIDVIIKAVVDYWKSRGMEPYIFPAMGSHGAATAEGQASVLEHYGIDEARMGCPIVSQLDTVSLGKTPEGLEAFMDRTAYESAGVMLVNRVKWHTDFIGQIESGLFKMMAIGIGKFAGAHVYHTHAYRMGLEAVIRSVGRQVLTSGKILGGLAILEDAYHHAGQLTAVAPDEMEAQEEVLLATAKSWMARIPAPAVDVLILDEIGKNYSGAGMDTKVVNRGIDGSRNPFDTAPPIERLYLRDVSDLSYGNSVGIGLADIVHPRILAKIDWNATRINSLTASTPTAIRTPISFPTDRENLEQIGRTVGKFDLSEITIAWIRNSLEVTELFLSETLRDHIDATPELEPAGEWFDLPFDETGDLRSPW